MENKRELTLWIIVFAVVFLFIMFMPQIEGLLSGRYHIFKKKGSAQEVEKITYPEYTECKLSGTKDPDIKATVSKNVRFTYTENGTVDTIILTTSYKFDKANNYNAYKNDENNNKQRAGVETTIDTNDNKRTFTKREVMTIKNMTDLTEYPTSYPNLIKYLNQNQYVCGEKK